MATLPKALLVMLPKAAQVMVAAMLLRAAPAMPLKVATTVATNCVLPRGQVSTLNPNVLVSVCVYVS